MKKKNYPKEVYIIWLISFVIGIEFFGPVMNVFFTDWGGINQFYIQLLQSAFTFFIFLLEIPTGVIGDIKGRKFSILLGFAFLTVGPLIYGSIPDFRIFLLGEFLFATGVAFKSGAQQALLFDLLKEKGMEKEFGNIQGINKNLQLAGMLLSAFVANYLVKIMSLNRIFQTFAISNFVAFVFLLVFIKEPEVENDEEFVPDYKSIIKGAFKAFSRKGKLLKMVIFSTLVSVGTYFVIWFYQPLLELVGVGIDDFGNYKAILLIAEIVLSYILIKLITNAKRRRPILLGIVMLIAVGILSFIITDNLIGVLLFIILAGGIGLKFKVIFSPFLNAHIKSRERATTLSFVSMFRRILLSVLNPLFGYVAVVNIKIALVMMAIFVVVGLAFLPAEEDLVLKDKG